MEIVTEKRSSDWIAFVKGHREMWEAGATEAEAVEKLRVTRNLPTSVERTGIPPVSGTDK